MSPPERLYCTCSSHDNESPQHLQLWASDPVIDWLVSVQPSQSFILHAWLPPVIATILIPTHITSSCWLSFSWPQTQVLKWVKSPDHETLPEIKLHLDLLILNFKSQNKKRKRERKKIRRRNRRKVGFKIYFNWSNLARHTINKRVWIIIEMMLLWFFYGRICFGWWHHDADVIKILTEKPYLLMSYTDG